MATAARYPLDTTYFFQQLASAEKCFLILDFDSTLARLAPEHQSHFPFPLVTDLLECIAASARTHLIVASTLSARELQPVLGFPDFEIWAHDGLDQIAPSAPGKLMQRARLRVHTRASARNRRMLISQRCARYPLAYLVGSAEAATGHEYFVLPELHLNATEVLTATPEPLVQFLADWLRVCAGEIC